MRNFGLCLIFMLLCSAAARHAQAELASTSGPAAIGLPQPKLEGTMSLEQVLANRRSVRTFAAEPLEPAEIAQLLWAAQGITGRDKRFRTAPSAGALHPLEVYVVAADVMDLKAGVYHYLPAKHSLELIAEGDLRNKVSEAALGQQAPARAPATILIAAVYSRCSAKYGARANRYVPMDAGHAAQNVLLQAVALNLGAVPMGAFDGDQLKTVVKLANDEEPLYIIPVGHVAK